MEESRPVRDQFRGVTQLGYLGLGVGDRPGWTEFAANVLGLQVNGNDGDGNVLIRMDGHHHRLILTEAAQDDLVFVGWEVRDADALAALAERARAFGLEVVEGTAETVAARRVKGLIQFVDPDGLATEICYGPLLDHEPFVSPRGVTGFVADELGLGHIVVAASDPDAYIRYLSDVLGARTSDHIALSFGPVSFTITFMHVNPRHHSIAVVPRMPVPGPPMKRLQHMMIEATTIDAVGIALDGFNRRGLPTGAFGRHTNDRMLSFYGKTPAGFDVEYGYGGMLIPEDANWQVSTWNAASIWGHGMPKPPPGEPEPAPHIG